MARRSPPLHRFLACLGLLLAALIGPSAAGSEPVKARHGIAMHGEPALPPGFPHFPYVNPQAPRGGRLVLALQGSFDSLNPLVVLGVAPDAATRYVLQSLMVRSLDEPFSLYGLVARSVEMPDDRSSVTFNLDPRARFADGRPLTAEDVRFTFELLKRFGKPLHRTTFGQVRAVAIESPHRIRFDLGGQDREVPLIVALMPIFAAHATDPERFDRTTLVPPLGSGPYTIVEVKPGERVVLRRRSDYWGEDLPVARGLFNFDEIRYDFYRDANSLFEAFKAGLYDFRFEDDASRWAGGYDFPALREGRVRRETFPIRTPKGMNGLVFNTRRPLFADIRVREALGLMFDFAWVNRNLYSGLLQRNASYFHGSELSAHGRPASEAERALLAPFPGAVRPDILEGRWSPPESDGSGRDRDLARRALDLLAKAGWTLRGGVLRRTGSGEPFAFEMLANTLFQERLALNYAQSLARIGVTLRIRRVDEPQYWRRLSGFDFDMMQRTWAVSLSPGAEQRNRWSARSAGQEGSLNYAGARSPAIDAMIDALLSAEGRSEFVTAVRALDRLLLSGFYVVPLFHVPDYWLAFDAALQHPPVMPLLGLSIDTWWRETR
ncbi:MAG TPA: extracellular solute-binding protein [Microvirga sp.]|jgi:peptide/nickel transport system substrate-binding protein|nr:extracellular solute-binding protein [Microvirga sp.]